MNPIPFVKASGCGNDFLIIEERFASGQPLEALSRHLCDRHNGIGADGVEWVGGGGQNFAISARLINADGSYAEISGNGTRCVAAYFVSAHPRTSVRVRTGAGVKECRLVSGESPEFHFEMDVGKPAIGERIPLSTAAGKFMGQALSM